MAWHKRYEDRSLEKGRQKLKGLKKERKKGVQHHKERRVEMCCSFVFLKCLFYVFFQVLVIEQLGRYSNGFSLKERSLMWFTHEELQ
jgi:hypothetical protein